MKKEYPYRCPKCETIIRQEEEMSEHSFKNPTPKCECGEQTNHLIEGSPMFRFNYNQ